MGNSRRARWPGGIGLAALLVATKAGCSGGSATRARPSGLVDVVHGFAAGASGGIGVAVFGSEGNPRLLSAGRDERRTMARWIRTVDRPRRDAWWNPAWRRASYIDRVRSSRCSQSMSNDLA
jgi:hypothetical protein